MSIESSRPARMILMLTHLVSYGDLFWNLTALNLEV
jgi:hypothetical protein